MKKRIVFLIFFIFLGVAAWGQVFTWTGNIDDDWNEPENWEIGGSVATNAPINDDNITIFIY